MASWSEKKTTISKLAKQMRCQKNVLFFHVTCRNSLPKQYKLSWLFCYVIFLLFTFVLISSWRFKNNYSTGQTNIQNVQFLASSANVYSVFVYVILEYVTVVFFCFVLISSLRFKRKFWKERNLGCKQTVLHTNSSECSHWVWVGWFCLHPRLSFIWRIYCPPQTVT